MSKARDIIGWWPWPASVSKSGGRVIRCFGSPYMAILVERPEDSLDDAYWRLARMAIANGFTLEGYDQPHFVKAIQRDLAWEADVERAVRVSPLISC